MMDNNGNGNGNTNEVYLFTMNTNGVAHISSSQNGWAKWVKCEPDDEADKKVGCDGFSSFFEIGPNPN
jgi:hypothetical protein